MLHLSNVPRFDMTVMCLPSRDKEALRVLWDQAAEVIAQGAGIDASGLRKSYRL